MQIITRTLACLAACGLLAAQPAAAAPSGRSAGAFAAGEDLAGAPDGSVPVIALISILALIAAVAVIVGGDDDDALPTSP